MIYDSWVGFGIGDEEGFDKALEGLGRIPEVIDGKVQHAIVDELEELSVEARAKLLSEPTHGIKQTGLRARIAAGMSVNTFEDDTGRGARIDVTAPAPDMVSIPWGLDSASRGWKHPVFGKKNEWVSEKGTLSWWQETMQKAQPDLDESLPQAINEAVDETFR